MSCLPDIFIPSKSQHLIPSKQAAPFSIHLRSSFFTNPKQQAQPQPRKTYISSDSKRYKSWMDTQRSFRQTKRSSRSYFYKESVSKEKVLEERGHSCENINSSQTHQIQHDTVSNFNAVKRSVLENTQLIQKILEMTNSQQKHIKDELIELKEGLTQELQQFQQEFKESMAIVLKIFRNEKRGALSDLKTIKAQIEYLQEQTNICQTTGRQLDGKFSKITSQFY